MQPWANQSCALPAASAPTEPRSGCAMHAAVTRRRQVEPLMWPQAPVCASGRRPHASRGRRAAPLLAWSRGPRAARSLRDERHTFMRAHDTVSARRTTTSTRVGARARQRQQPAARAGTRQSAPALSCRRPLLKAQFSSCHAAVPAKQETLMCTYSHSGQCHTSQQNSKHDPP